MRHFFLFLLLFFCASCSYFSTNNDSDVQPKDSVIDFTKVDVSPSFKACDKLTGEAKTKCFRENMHQQLTKNLNEYQFETKKVISEEIEVVLKINKNGKVILKNIKASSFLKEEIPDLIPLLKKTINSLSVLRPATKRGIPVNTEYKLPIKIQTE